MVRLENVLKISLQDILKMSWRHLEDVFKTSWRRLEDIWPRRIYWSWPRRLEDVFWRLRLRQTYSSWSRRLLKTKTKDVFKTSSSRRLFAGVRAVDNATIGHLPREISRSTKYLLDRGATVKAVMICSYYRCSPLFQGGLEIPCSVTVSMPGTIRNHLLLDRYSELVTELYCKPKDEIVIGNFLSPTEQVPIERSQNRQKRFSVPEKETIQCKDIRILFRCQEENNKNHDKSKETNEAIVID